MKLVILLAAVIAAASAAVFEMPHGHEMPHGRDVPHVQFSHEMPHGQFRHEMPHGHFEHDMPHKHSVDQGQYRDSKILKYDMVNDPEQGYKYNYETSDGIHRNEEAVIKRIDEKTSVLSVHGDVAYTDANGRSVKWDYTADENGYVPSHILIN